MATRKEYLDKKAQDDVKRGDYSPPWGWTPGPAPAGTTDRDTYDRAHKHHKEERDSGRKK
jgi:hypothetical protein